MSAGHQFSKTGQTFIVTAAFIIILAGIKHSGDILIPILLALFIALVAEMPLSWMQGKGLPRWIGLIIVMFVGLLIEILLIAFIGETINNITASFPAYEQRIIAIMQNLQSILSGLGFTVNQKMIDNVANHFNPTMVMNILGNIASDLGRILSNGFVIFFMTAFLLLDIPNLPAKLKKTNLTSDTTEIRLRRFNHALKNYLGVYTAISLLTGILITIWLSILGVDFPILWGFLAFMLNFVPNIGSIIAATPAILLAFLQGGLNLGLMTTLCYVTVNVLIGNIISPKIMGKELDLSTLAVFLSLIFWGWLLGPVGMLFSIPLTMVIKIAVDGDKELGWLAIWLSSGEDLKEESGVEKS